MTTFQYRFNGLIYSLTLEERKQFNNNDLSHRVNKGHRYIFYLKEGGQIEGKVIKIKVIKAESPFDYPLQVEFTIIPPDQKESIVLNFTQIESHENVFLAQPLFKSM